MRKAQYLNDFATLDTHAETCCYIFRLALLKIAPEFVLQPGVLCAFQNSWTRTLLFVEFNFTQEVEVVI
jgi:hypothetical protein